MLPSADRDIEMMLQGPSLCGSNLKEFFITLVSMVPGVSNYWAVQNTAFPTTLRTLQPSVPSAWVMSPRRLSRARHGYVSQILITNLQHVDLLAKIFPRLMSIDPLILKITPSRMY
jgi:hypothetical protein